MTGSSPPAPGAPGGVTTGEPSFAPAFRDVSAGGGHGDRRARPGVAACLLVAGAAVLAAACSRPGTGSGVAVRDSAGIVIVENRAPGDGAPGDGLAFPEEPALDLGSMSGPDRLFQVEDATRLSDGRVVVANAGSSELFYFGPGGRLLDRAGGEGGGPGEFGGGGRSPSDVTRIRGDTVLAFDPWSRRVSVFGPRGDFVRSVVLDAPEDGAGGLVAPVGWLGDGRFVGRALEPGGSAPALDGTRSRSRERVMIFSREGQVEGTLGVFPGREMRILAPDVDPSGGRFAVRAGDVPFRRKLAVHAGRSRVAVANTERYEVRIYDASGALRRLIRHRGARPAEVTEELREAWIETRLSGIEDLSERRARRRELEGLRFPARTPALAAVMLDARDRTWVKAFRPPTASGPVGWSVYDREDRVVHRVQMPAGLEPLEIGEGYVLGLARDELDLPHVRLYELE